MRRLTENLINGYAAGSAAEVHRNYASDLKETRMDRREMLIGLGLSPVLVSMLARTGLGQEGEGGEEKMVDYLFVQTSHAGSIRNGELRMTRIAPATLYFSDRPERLAGHVPTDAFVATGAPEGATVLKPSRRTPCCP
jgi:hypothetical protein